MAVRVWRRRFRRCIRGHDISVAGCIRCATSWRKCGSQTMRKYRPERRPFIWRKGGAKPKPLFAASAPAGGGVRRGGATAGTGLTGVAVVLRLSPAPVAQTAHHQRDRALLRGSATENPTYGVLCERRKCGPHHLLHLPEIQSGMENPHPQPIYTSCLTSPAQSCGSEPCHD